MRNFKNIGKLLAIILFTTFGMVAKAQTHVKAAANCLLHDAYVKEASKTKNAVSCVDCYCKVCGDKKANEKEAKNKARELADKQHAEKQKLADEKARAEQKKKAEIERAKAIQKAKDNEAILVAPKPSGKSTVVKLSADDQKIIDIAKNLEQKDKLLVGYCSEKERSYWSIVYPVIKNTGKIILDEFRDGKHTETILKDNFNIKSKFPYTSFFGGYGDNKGYSENKGFQVTGFFIIEFINFQNMSENSYSELVENSWTDLVDIQGNCVFNNTNIKNIRYKEKDKTFIIQKKGQGNFSEEYNPATKKTTPIQ